MIRTGGDLQNLMYGGSGVAAVIVYTDTTVQLICLRWP